MKINKKHLEKLEILAATGMPGVYKVLVFFLVQHVYGLNTLGSLASWQSIAQILGFFTAIGWSSLIMVRVPQAETIKKQVETLNGLMIMSAITLSAFILIINAFGIMLSRESDALQVSYWLVAWTVYQVLRHYFIALKKYRKVLFLDGVIILLSIAIITQGSIESVSFQLAFVMFLTSAVLIIVNHVESKPSKSYLKYDMKGIEYGFINLLSGGVALGMIPLAKYFEGESIAGTLSLFISITSIALLIPRAISLNGLPDLTRKIRNDIESAREIKDNLIFQISLSNIFTTITSVVVLVVFMVFIPEGLELKLIALLIIIITQNSITVQTLVYCTVMMCKEDSSELLKINIFSFVVFVIATMFVLYFSLDPYIHISLCVLLMYFYRYIAVKRRSNDILSCV